MISMTHQSQILKHQRSLDPKCPIDELSKSRKCSKNCSPKKSRMRIKKQVRFSPVSFLYITSPKTEGDLNATWYSKNELVQFKQNGKAEAQALSQSNSAFIISHVAYSVAFGEKSRLKATDEEKEMINGIEHLLSTEVLTILLRRRKKTISGVLDEQKAQNGIGIKDPIKLALVSEKTSGFAKDLRQRIACV